MITASVLKGLNGQCLTESMVYQANITANIPAYKTSKQNDKNDTELSIEYWKIKQQNAVRIIKWKVLRKCHAYN